MKKQLIYLLFISLILASCHNNVYKKWDDKAFPKYIWNADIEVVFEPEILDVERTYEIILGLRHVHGVKIQNIPVGVAITAPSGKTETKLYSIMVTDSKGKELANCSGSLCDIETTVETAFKFQEKGIHKILVKQLTPFEKLNGIMELGLIIK